MSTSLDDAIKFLSVRGVRIGVQGGSLRVIAEKAVLTDEVKKVLQKHRDALLQWATIREGLRADCEFEITHIDRNAPLPLSLGQLRLWFLSQYEERDRPVYTDKICLRLHGELNQSCFIKACNSLVARHETLRTTFQEQKLSDPVQIIADKLEITVPIIDVKEQSVEEQIALHIRKPFDLSKGPLLKIILLRISEVEHVLVISIHHIISDGWSLGVLLRELSALYVALQEESPDGLPELPVQYVDYAAWQRERLQGKILEDLRGYWRKQLDGAPALLNIPADYPRPVVQSYQGSAVYFHLGKTLVNDLHSLGRAKGATLFMLLLAAFKVLLWRYGGQEDVVVGTPVANRDRPELENLIGFFVNTLALRSQINGQLSFWNFLQQVKQTALDAYQHQDIPFEHVVEMLNPERSLSYGPLFQVMFVMQNQPSVSPTLGEIKITGQRHAVETSKFDLTINIAETMDGLRGRLEYSTDLFDQSTIARMADHFQQLVQGIVANPDQTLSALPLLTLKEHHQIVHEWNDTASEFPHEKCIHELFEEQAARAPHNVAVVFGDRRLTYAELNARANQLAHYLIERGVKPDTLVGLCIERSLEMIIGLLGILKAGGAYVPLDPDYPEARLVFMLEDADTPITLTQTDLIQRIPLQDRHIVCLDKLEIREALQTYSVDNPDGTAMGLMSRHLAYVIYTSGSTGQPKGVMIEHAALHNFLQAIQATPGIAETDKLLAITPISFDIAGLELFLPLLSGAQLHIAGSTQTKDSHALQTLIQENDITLMQGTPATWQLLLDGGWAGKSDMVVLCGGEAWPEQLATKLREKVKAQWNMYGADRDDDLVGGVAGIGECYETANWWADSEYGVLCIG